MRKFFYILAFVFALLLPLSIVNAAELRQIEDATAVITEDIQNDFYVGAKDSVVIEGDIAGDLFVAGGSVDIQGTVGGDLYAAGGTIVVDNEVSGSIFIVGGNLRVNDFVEKNLYAAGGNITIDGEIGEDVLATGGQIELNGTVGDDVRMSGGSLRVNGTINDDLMTSFGTATVNTNVGGDIFAAGGSLIINADEVGGDIQFYGKESQLTLSDNLNVVGDVSINEPVNSAGTNIDFNWGELSVVALVFRFIWSIIQVVGLVAVGVILVKLAPVKTDNILKNFNGFTNQLKSFGIGCLALPVGIVIMLALLLSLFGIPVAKLLFAFAMVVLAVITPLAGLALGRFVLGWFDQKRNYLLALFLGIIILQLMKSIPILGGLVGFYVFCLVVGGVLRMMYQKQRLANQYKVGRSYSPSGAINSNQSVATSKGTNNKKSNKKSKK